MAQTLFDFTGMADGQEVSAAHPNLTATESWNTGTAVGSTPAGYATFTSNGDRPIYVASGLVMPDGGYRAHLNQIAANGEGARRSYGPCARVQSDYSCYTVYRHSDGTGLNVVATLGGQYGVHDRIVGTELGRVGSIAGDYNAGIDPGIRCEDIDANTVRIHVYADRSSAALFFVDDTDAGRITAAGKPGMMVSHGAAHPDLRMLDLFVDDLAAAGNLGIRLDVDSTTPGQPYPDTTGIIASVLSENRQTFLGDVTGNVVSGVLAFDNAIFDALSVNDRVCLPIFDSLGEPLGLTYGEVVDLNVTTDFSDD